MERITRSEYEKWIRDNNVPYYKRALYDDDPERVMAAVKREQEEMRRLQEERSAELARQRARERERNGGKDVYAANIYVTGEDTRYREEDDRDFEDEEDEEIDVVFDEDEDYGEDDTAFAAQNSPKLYGEETGTGISVSPKPAPVPQKKKKPKNKGQEKLKKAHRLVFTALLAAVVVLVIGIAIVNSIEFGTYKLGYITIGEVTETGRGTAYFARKSDPILSPDTGIFMAVLSEGDRVDAGGTIGYIVKEENRSVLSRLKQVNATILALMNMGDGSERAETEEQLAEVNAKIAEKRALLTEMAARGDLSRCGDVENEINALISERDRILVEAESGSDSILSLKREKEDLERVINEKMTPVTSQKAGVVSFHVSDSDDAESDLYDSLASGSTSAVLSSLSLFENAGVRTALNANVLPGDVICRVVRNQDYYIVLKASDSTELLSGLVTVKSGDLSFQATGNVSTGLFGDGYAVVSTMRGLKNSLTSKNIDVTYDISRSSGYCVPLSALSDWDKNHSTARIAVVKAGFVQFKYVGVKACDDEKAIITSSPYDSAEIVYANGEPVPNSKIAEITAGTCYVVDIANVKDGQQIS